MKPRIFAAVAGVLAVSACTGSGPRSSPSVLLPGVGAGYRLANASGSLTRDALASATALPKPVMTSYLSGVTYRDAGERVWTSPADGFVTDIVVTFGSRQEASGLVALASKKLPGPATRSFTPPEAPAARGFVQTSDVAGSTMFCVIAFAPSGARAFVVTRCTPYPQDTVTLSRLLVQQLARAG